MEAIAGPSSSSFSSSSHDGGDEKRFRLRDLKDMISCKLCHGFLIEPTTITECLHTFCKACIVKHLETDYNESCPVCPQPIERIDIAHDRTMQDLVNKILPSLEKEELERERKFYAEHGLPCPKDQIGEKNEAKKDKEVQRTSDDADEDFHRFDEQINMVLECHESFPLKNLERKYIRCSWLATVAHIKKFVAMKVLSSLDKYKEVDILCNGKTLYKDHTLKFVYVTCWRGKKPPMKLQYVAKEDTMPEA